MMVVAMAGPEISSCIRRKLGRMSVPRSAAHNINTATHHTVTVLCLRPSFTVTSPSYGQSTATAGPGHCMLELCMLSLSVPTRTSPLHTYPSLATKRFYEDHLHLPLSLSMQLSPSPRLLFLWARHRLPSRSKILNDAKIVPPRSILLHSMNIQPPSR